MFGRNWNFLLLSIYITLILNFIPQNKKYYNQTQSSPMSNSNTQIFVAKTIVRIDTGRTIKTKYSILHENVRSHCLLQLKLWQ